jgi:hypothetical protein
MQLWLYVVPLISYRGHRYAGYETPHFIALTEFPMHADDS